MIAPLPLVGVCLVCLCQTPAEKASPGWDLWQQAQEALRQGQNNRAIELYEESLGVDPRLTRNYLGLAAAWLDKGADARACLHLTLYVAAHPEHLAVRVQYAELLRRLHRLPEAREEYEHFVADAQEQGAVADEHLLHCHSQLMQLAESRADEYDEHLHRGIGLYLLALQQGRRVEGEVSAESLLCRAAGELTQAHRVHPDEARPSWYLHEVWSRLAQSQPAARCLRAAAAAAPFSYLTPAEERGLYLAYGQRERWVPLK